MKNTNTLSDTTHYYKYKLIFPEAMETKQNRMAYVNERASPEFHIDRQYPSSRKIK